MRSGPVLAGYRSQQFVANVLDMLQPSGLEGIAFSRKLTLTDFVHVARLRRLHCLRGTLERAIFLPVPC